MIHFLQLQQNDTDIKIWRYKKLWLYIYISINAKNDTNDADIISIDTKFFYKYNIVIQMIQI